MWFKVLLSLLAYAVKYMADRQLITKVEEADARALVEALALRKAVVDHISAIGGELSDDWLQGVPDGISALAVTKAAEGAGAAVGSVPPAANEPKSD